jgi:hypothetical protein
MGGAEKVESQPLSASGADAGQPVKLLDKAGDGLCGRNGTDIQERISLPIT